MGEVWVAGAFLAGALLTGAPLVLLLWLDHRRSLRLARRLDALEYSCTRYALQIDNDHLLAGRDFVEGLRAAMREDS